MQIDFHREAERKVSAMVRRDDGVTVRVPGYGHVMPLPHDLAHFVVERELELEWGFWARVVAGAVFPGMAVVSGRRPPTANARSRAAPRRHSTRRKTDRPGAFLTLTTYVA